MALINCPECSKQISDKAQACPHCGYPINTINNIPAQPSVNYGLKCPVCFSSNVVVNSKGFSGKKAVAGALAFGEIGVLAGALGSSDIICSCVDCGHKFNPKNSVNDNDQELWDKIDKMLEDGGVYAAAKLYKNAKKVDSKSAVNIIEKRLRERNPDNADEILKESDKMAKIVSLVVFLVIVVVIFWWLID